MPTTNQPPAFAQALRARVEASRKSQYELCAEIGCAYSALRHWMTGVRRPRAVAVVALESALGLKRGTIERDAKKLSRSA